MSNSNQPLEPGHSGDPYANNPGQPACQPIEQCFRYTMDASTLAATPEELADLAAQAPQPASGE